jgi:hypothetical protein
MGHGSDRNAGRRYGVPQPVEDSVQVPHHSFAVPPRTLPDLKTGFLL